MSATKRNKKSAPLFTRREGRCGVRENSVNISEAVNTRWLFRPHFFRATKGENIEWLLLLFCKCCRRNGDTIWKEKLTLGHQWCTLNRATSARSNVDTNWWGQSRRQITTRRKETDVSSFSERDHCTNNCELFSSFHTQHKRVVRPEPYHTYMHTFAHLRVDRKTPRRKTYFPVKSDTVIQ